MIPCTERSHKCLESNSSDRNSCHVFWVPRTPELRKLLSKDTLHRARTWLPPLLTCPSLLFCLSCPPLLSDCGCWQHPIMLPGTRVTSPLFLSLSTAGTEPCIQPLSPLIKEKVAKILSLIEEYLSEPKQVGPGRREHLFPFSPVPAGVLHALPCLGLRVTVVLSCCVLCLGPGKKPNLPS